MRTTERRERRYRFSTAEYRKFAGALAFLLSGGLGLEEALEVQAGAEKRGKMKSFLEQLQLSLQSGFGLGSSLRRLLDRPDPVFIPLAEAGETSGKLGKCLSGMGVYLERKIRTRKHIGNTAAYPLFLLVLMAAGLVLYFLRVLPAAETLRRELSGSGILSSDSLPEAPGSPGSSFLLPVPAAILLAGAAVGWVLRRRGRGRPLLPERLHRDRDCCLLFSILEILTESGVSLEEALMQSRRSLGPTAAGRELDRFLPRLIRGEPADRLFGDSRYFPPLVGRWICFSREAGRLPEALGGLRQYFENRLESRNRLLLRWMEPALILAAGGMLLALVCRLVLPLFDLMEVPY